MYYLFDIFNFYAYNVCKSVCYDTDEISTIEAIVLVDGAV